MRAVLLSLSALLMFGTVLPAYAADGDTTVVVVVPPPNPAPSIPGAFSRLSPGQQAHAQALFDSQIVLPHGPSPMTLDQIATLRGTTGWGNVFKNMKAQGLLTQKNFGQVVRGAHHPMTTTTTVTATSRVRPVTMVNGRGHVITSGVSGRSGTHGRGTDATETTTVASNAGGVSAGVSHGANAGGITRAGGVGHGSGGNGGGPKR